MSAVPQSGVLWSPMRSEDIANVFAIEKAAYEFPWTEGNFRDSLAAGYQCWVCRAGPRGLERLLGYFVLMLGAGEAHLLNLCVAVPMQRRGWGRELLGQAMSVACAHAAAAFILEVRPSNAAGLQLYARAGFRHIGRRRDYYPAHPSQGGREDALVLEMKLS